MTSPDGFALWANDFFHIAFPPLDIVKIQNMALDFMTKIKKWEGEKPSFIFSDLKLTIIVLLQAR